MKLIQKNLYAVINIGHKISLQNVQKAASVLHNACFSPKRFLKVTWCPGNPN